jgi:nucleoside-diphosphate-sugar epimerase
VKILLIGATGFIGPYVVRALVRQGHAVTVFHRGLSQSPLPESVGRITGDRNDLASHRDELRRLAPDVVVDLILSSERQAKLLMDTFRGVVSRVVALSSADVYRACGILHGSEPGPIQPVPLTENSELRTRLQVYPPEVIRRLQAVFTWLDGEYDKIPVERAVMHDPDLHGTVLRLPMVYGPGDPLHRLFPYLKRVDDGRPAILIEEGAAHWRGPRGYVENVAAAITQATVLSTAAGRIYNVAEPESFSEMEWVQKIARSAKWDGRILAVSKDLLPAHLRANYNTEQQWVVSSARIRHELGFVEPVDAETALARTIAWERTNPPAQVDPNQFDYAAEDKVIAQIDTGAGAM